MKRLLAITSLGAVAIWMSACGAPATNAPANNANTNTNTAKPVAAAPTAEALLDIEKKANEAYSKGDAAFFDGLLADKTVMSNGKERMGKAEIVAMMKTVKCEGVETKLSDPQLSKIDNDTYAISYKNESTGKCAGADGKMTEFKPTRASTVYIRNGEKWQAVWHGENTIMSAPPTGEKKDEAKKDEPKKDEKAAATDKAETKPANANSASNTAAAPAPAKLTPSANTEALAKLHSAGWEAFRNKDAKAFDAGTMSNFAVVGPAGDYMGSKADAIKRWTETMKCEGITKTSFTEAFAQSISPTVEILFGKGTADGKCDGMPVGDLWQTTVYVKDGDAWKMAFMFETPGA